MTTLSTIPEYDKDVKKTAKKYPSLYEDLEKLYKALRAVRIIEIRGTVRISNLGAKYEQYPVFKVRSFKCASLHCKGANSGIRVIYYDDTVKDELTLIELYCKNTQENEDRNRIIRFLDSLPSE